MSRSWSFAGWFYKQNGIRVGPLSGPAIQQHLAAGQLRPTDRVWQKWTNPSGCKLVSIAAESVVYSGEPGGVDSRSGFAGSPLTEQAALAAPPSP